jgi:hypothetical protein
MRPSNLLTLTPHLLYSYLSRPYITAHGQQRFIIRRKPRFLCSIRLGLGTVCKFLGKEGHFKDEK